MEAASTPILSRPDGRACPEYWRLYLAWVRAPAGQQDALRARMRDHIAVFGCRLGLGGKWSPLHEDEIKDEKAGGWNVPNFD
jgi:hypothetical protein